MDLVRPLGESSSVFSVDSHSLVLPEYETPRTERHDKRYTHRQNSRGWE